MTARNNTLSLKRMNSALFVLSAAYQGIAYVKIEYHPTGGKCVELKSLKYYFVSFRNVGIYQEAATKRIYNDLRSALRTDELQVTTIYNIRGGFETTCIEGSLS
ncbi:MAG: hypothetical protein Ct9H300mP9_0330 [Candidatus Neomarinimicrobiota bacterium]|nr:MAG: hypothetical protein Ct9H300mP9_0330 [Candidatus Neomarinimicrobiota bacterium]